MKFLWPCFPFMKALAPMTADPETQLPRVLLAIPLRDQAQTLETDPVYEKVRLFRRANEMYLKHLSPSTLFRQPMASRWSLDPYRYEVVE